MVWADIENGESGASVRAKLNALGRGAAPILGAYTTLFQLIGANLNVTTDQAFAKAMNFSKFIPMSIFAVNANAPVVNAAGGIYTGASKSGIAVVAASQSWAGLTSTTKVIHPTIAAAGQAVHPGGLFLSLTTPKGSAGTCDIYVMGVAWE